MISIVRSHFSAETSGLYSPIFAPSRLLTGKAPSGHGGRAHNATKESLHATRDRLVEKYKSAKPIVRRQDPVLWTLITERSPPVDHDVEFWWRTTGLPLAILLESADYSIPDQCQQLLFYYRYVVPELGPRSDDEGKPWNWRSFMTDHFAPVEMSWEWATSAEDLKIRYSFEPIGQNAGTEADPLNQFATKRVFHRCHNLIQGCETELFDHFSKELLSYDKTPLAIKDSDERHGHRSRSFLAVELDRDEVMIKAYFFPAFKAAEQGVSTWSLISDAIQNASKFSHSVSRSLLALDSFLSTCSEGSNLTAEIFAVDCEPPAASRFKIYMRSPHTTFESVRTILSLNGLLDSAQLGEVHELWKLLFTQGPSASTDQSLRDLKHRTAGILYYFDLRPGRDLPGVKVYFPVRHYADSDLSVAEALETYWKRQGRKGRAGKYSDALKAISDPSSIANARGLQTYLGCSVTDGALKLTSYLAPNVYSCQTCNN